MHKRTWSVQAIRVQKYTNGTALHEPIVINLWYEIKWEIYVKDFAE